MQSIGRWSDRETGVAGWVSALRWLSVGAIAVLGVVECMTLSSIVKQAEAARAFDQAITDQIYEIQPNIPKGSEVFVAMTVPTIRETASGEMCHRVISMEWPLRRYGISIEAAVNQITYANAVRSPQDPPDEGFYRLAERYANIDRDHVFPFVVNEDLSVMGVKSVTIFDQDGALVDELTFPSMDDAKADRLISPRIAQRRNN